MNSTDKDSKHITSGRFCSGFKRCTAWNTSL